MQNVLDSVISALLEDKNRKFIYVEMVIVMMIIIVLSFGACINCDADFFFIYYRHFSRDGGGSKVKL